MLKIIFPELLLNVNSAYKWNTQKKKKLKRAYNFLFICIHLYNQQYVHVHLNISKFKICQRKLTDIRVSMFPTNMRWIF